ncbi:DHA2 family efflux MFS transporter permease subunit [Actinoplanes sp. NPDC023714]|uniref:DHA2 family efflux MFS transporter permease subunit n=1 Tax=Actinoplanes sp. NPDC023714 TaxID=3154322 RepID=UPI0033EE812E
MRPVRALGLTLALGGLMVVVDTTVTVVAVPAIVAGLDAPLAAAQWVTTGYLLGLVAVIPLSGWASSRFGARRVYLTALLVFTVFSACAGLAWSVASLAVFRFLQGLGGGLLNPVGQAIGLRAVPREQRGRLMSLLVLPLVIGPVFGPPLAGWLISSASWRWIFLINIPLGLVAVAVCARLLPRSVPSAETPGVDWPGLMGLSGGAILLVYGGTLLDRPGTPVSTAVLVLTAGLVLLASFVRRARRVAEPIVDLGLLSRPLLRAGLGVLATFAAGYFGSMAVLPLYVQAVNGDPASLVGVLALPQAVAVGLVAQVATRLVDRVPPRRIVLTGTSLGLLGGAGLAAAMMTGAGYPWIVAAWVVLSAGSGATLMPTMTIALRDLENATTPKGTSLFALSSQLSAAVGGAAVAVLLGALVTAHVPDGVAGMLALDPAARDALRPDLALAVGGAFLLPVALLAVSATIAVRSLRPAPDPVRAGVPATGG